jgi:hypothetical protein
VCLADPLAKKEINAGVCRYSRFRYPRFYFNMMSNDILSADTAEAAAQFHWLAHHFDSGDYKLRLLTVYHS